MKTKKRTKRRQPRARIEDPVYDVSGVGPVGPLNDLARRCHETSKEKGWWPGLRLNPKAKAGYRALALRTCRNVPEILALIHSEASEALEEYRADPNGIATLKWLLKPRKGLKAHDDLTGRADAVPFVVREGEWPDDRSLSESDWTRKPVGFATEIADVIIRCLDLMHVLGVDVDEVVRDKMAYNAGRDHRHGGKAC